MFRMGGPIKEGIMDGIEEPRQGFQNAGFVTGQQILDANINNPFLQSGQVKINPFSRYAPGQSTGPLDNLIKATMFDTEKFPLVGKETGLSETASLTDFYTGQGTPLPSNNLIVSAAPVKIPGDKITTDINLSEVSEEGGGGSEVITEDDIEEVKTPLQIPDRNRGKILSDPDRKIKAPEPDSELLKKLGYDRAVKKGNYALIEAIRKGLTEGGVQGALDAAFAAGATDPYGEASKIRQAAALKEFERKTDLEDYEKKLKLKSKFDKTSAGKGIIQKNYEFLTGVLKMDPDKATRIATKSHATIDEAIFDVQKGSGLPAINTNVLDSAGGLFYGNEYKGKAPDNLKIADAPDGWYLVKGNQFVEIKDGKKVDESRTYEVAQR